MKNRLKTALIFLLLNQLLFATCTDNQQFWQDKIQKSTTIETFFIENHACQNHFYKALNSHEKIYFDTVLYPNKLTATQYRNRWMAMLLSDKEFFKQFSFFNNYFTTHKNSVSNQELRCFQKQKGFKEPVDKMEFYSELEKRGMSHDVGYLYPLIRWSHDATGRDMSLSRERVSLAESIFGIKKGEVGNGEQLARYLSIFDNEYTFASNHLADKLNIETMDAYKLLAIITYLESRGNIFATSTTGAFGPMQLTMHYYMMYGEPNNPFNPKASLIKLVNKFIHYHRVGYSLDSSVISYKSGSLTKCQNGAGRGSADCRYYYDYKKKMHEMQFKNSKDEVSRHLAGASYFSVITNSLKRRLNPKNIRDYEPYQYAILKGNTLKERVKESMLKSGQYFNSLGKMKRSDIYRLQDRYGVGSIGVISDKKVCY
ncbi:MAG TPA: hypothetical protein EYG90_04795 [Campylobacterales bacterium]|nr:hypothetical protein [Campylobacterales bacterium]